MKEPSGVAVFLALSLKPVISLIIHVHGILGGDSKERGVYINIRRSINT